MSLYPFCVIASKNGHNDSRNGDNWNRRALPAFRNVDNYYSGTLPNDPNVANRNRGAFFNYRNVDNCLPNGDNRKLATVPHVLSGDKRSFLTAAE